LLTNSIKGGKKTESLAVSSDKERKRECVSKFSLVDVYVTPAIRYAFRELFQ
jgi:hypothetical protein